MGLGCWTFLAAMFFLRVASGPPVEVWTPRDDFPGAAHVEFIPAAQYYWSGWCRVTLVAVPTATILAGSVGVGIALIVRRARQARSDSTK
jgi:hypothetical protein